MMEDLKSYIGSNIKRYRKVINMTSIELGEKSDTSQSTISDIERGTRSPQIDTLIKICEALGVTLYDVLPENLKPSSEETLSPEVGRLIKTAKALSPEDVNLVNTSLLTTDCIHVLKAFSKLNAHEKKLLIDLLNSLMSRL